MEVDELFALLSKVRLLPSIAEFMEVAGGIVSTVQLIEAGCDPTFPTLSFESILKLCKP